ncbi:hypothetical protein FB567DRAFT_599113 [Paraphoma chrysanthemicola]|uniref:BZIP domain-containing protein n=1 Tax=Paraphoma chrysanthemicola TaxID=798071 RepID=A0A8K0QS10_9PLEO|nr:hypothetical protein FB567DRAFT_599113 [Paraphoma chrysanthemicola]
MPAGKPRNTKTPEHVPRHGDPDRKRVLNVLAQRRYRQRRRERIAALEAKAVRSSSPPDDQNVEEAYPVVVNLDQGAEAEGVAVETFDEMPVFPGEYTPSMDFGSDAFDLSLLEFTHLPSPLPTTPSESPLSVPRDGTVLSVPILAAIRAFGTVAVALDVVAHLWDPTYMHVLSPSAPSIASLPANLHPVPAQLTIPHHPLLDLLPWPNVREKLICMLSMPSAFRPPVAREVDEDDETCQAFTFIAAGQHGAVKQSTAIVQLVQDLDDLQDGAGVRVHGNSTTWGEGNELTEDAWEVGDLFYSGARKGAYRD